MLLYARLTPDIVVNLVNPEGTLIRPPLNSSLPIGVVAGMFAMISCIRLSAISPLLRQLMFDVPGKSVEGPQVHGVIKDAQGQ